MSGRIRDCNRGLTPVVGIVLLIAITLLLASTVAAFAFGLGDQTRETRVPTVAVSFEYERVDGGDDTLDIVHKSGEDVAVDNLDVDIEGATCSGGNPDGHYDLADFGPSGEFTAGETATIDGSSFSCSGDLDLSTATVRVTWVSEAGASTEIQTWHGPG